MAFKIALQFLFLHLCVYFAYSWECQKYDDTTTPACQMGTAGTTLNCPQYDSCYEENIVKGSIPPYRRGCANWDWCDEQIRNHGSALKYCRTCQGDKCNNKAFEAPSKKCLICNASVNSTCQMGTTENEFTCATEDDSCYEEYIQRVGSDPFYRRGCGPWNWCASQKKTHGDALTFCRTCRGDNCNNQAIKLPIPLNCIGCEGSVNSTCQMGKSQNSYRCQPWLPACYEEYIQRVGYKPLYRRYCGLPDRCITSSQPNVQGDNLKYCRTCKEDNCNNKAIELVIRHECIKCTGSSYSYCQTGEEETTEICRRGKDVCSELIYRTNDKAFHYRRSCAPWNVCDMQQNIAGGSLEYCRTCKEKNCNKQYMASDEELLQKEVDDIPWDSIELGR